MRKAIPVCLSVLLSAFLGTGSAVPATTAGDSCRLCPRPAKTDFAANWIWLPESVGYEWRNSYAYFRKAFEASGKLTIDIAADNYYQLYLYGKLIERGTAPSDVAYKTFDTYEVDLESGRHVLAVLVHHIGQVCAEGTVPTPLGEISVSWKMADGKMKLSYKAPEGIKVVSN